MNKHFKKLMEYIIANGIKLGIDDGFVLIDINTSFSVYLLDSGYIIDMWAKGDGFHGFPKNHTWKSNDKIPKEMFGKIQEIFGKSIIKVIRQ